MPVSKKSKISAKNQNVTKYIEQKMLLVEAMILLNYIFFKGFLFFYNILFSDSLSKIIHYMIIEYLRSSKISAIVNLLN